MSWKDKPNAAADGATEGKDEKFDPFDNVTADGCCDHTEVIADDDVHRYAIG